MPARRAAQAEAREWFNSRTASGARPCIRPRSSWADPRATTSSPGKGPPSRSGASPGLTRAVTRLQRGEAQASAMIGVAITRAPTLLGRRSNRCPGREATSPCSGMCLAMRVRRRAMMRCKRRVLMRSGRPTCSHQARQNMTLARGETPGGVECSRALKSLIWRRPITKGRVSLRCLARPRSISTRRWSDSSGRTRKCSK